MAPPPQLIQRTPICRLTNRAAATERARATLTANGNRQWMFANQDRDETLAVGGRVVDETLLQGQAGFEIDHAEQVRRHDGADSIDRCSWVVHR